jgi:hypothetical protein
MKKILCLLCFTAIAASAQTIKVTTPAEPDTLTLTLAYEASDPKFTPKECFWYLPRHGDSTIPDLLIHSGCGSFTREYGKGEHLLLLLVNGRGKFGDLLDQRKETINISVRPRVEVKHDIR